MGRQLFSSSTAFVIVTREIMIVLRVNLALVFSPFNAAIATVIYV